MVFVDAIKSYVVHVILSLILTFGVSKFDLLKGYWKVPLIERVKEVSTFVTPDGLFQYHVMLFRMKNVPATFQRMMNSVICGLKGYDAYIDNIVVYSATWEDHVQQLRDFFTTLRDAQLTINLSKSEFCQARVVFLGHVVGQGEVALVVAKIEAILKFPVPTDKHAVMRFLGMPQVLLQLFRSGRAPHHFVMQTSEVCVERGVPTSF